MAKSRKAAARAARTHRRVYVTGCGANLAGDAFAGLPENVVVVARRSEETAAFVAGDVGAIGCVQADARLDRVRAFVKVQDGCSFSCNFCVIPLVRGASRSRRAAAVLAEIERRVEQGHREVVLTGINLGCYRDREAGYDLPRLVRAAGEVPGLERLRLSSIEINHVDDELVRALRETPVVEQAPARAAAVGRRRRAPGDGAPVLGRDVPAPARAAAGRVQPHERRHRRLPGGGRARVREHAAHGARGGPDEAARLPVLASSRHRDGARRPGAARGQARAGRAAARALGRRLPRALADEGRTRGRRARRPARPRLRRRLLAVARRRAGRPSSSACAARPSPRRASLQPDCLFCTLYRDGDHVASHRRLRRHPRHQPAGGDAPARHPRAAHRQLPPHRRVHRRRGQAHARLHRRSRCRGRA